MQAKSGLTGRHILIVLSGILILLGPCALVYNTWSVFVVPVSSALNASPAQFSAYITVIYLVSAIAAPFVGNLMERKDLRVVLSASVVLVVAGIALCSLWTEVWQFYLSGVLEGLGIVSCMFLAVPTLINRWFSVHTGLLIGLCMAMSGIGGALWSYVGGVIISSAGYQSAYAVYAIATAALALPATLFFVRSRPSDVGLTVYGEVQNKVGEGAAGESVDAKGSDAGSLPLESMESTQDFVEMKDSKRAPGPIPQSIPAAVFFKTSTFVALAIAISLFNALTAAGNMVPSYAYYLGEHLMAGITPVSATMVSASIASIFMIVAAISKVSLGFLCDRSALVALLVACGGAALGIVAVWLCGVWGLLLYVGAVGVGIMYAIVDSLGPSLTRNIVGPKDYTIIYARISVFINLAGAAGVIIFSLLAEAGWAILWAVTLATIALSFALCLFALNSSKKLVK